MTIVETLCEALSELEQASLQFARIYNRIGRDGVLTSEVNAARQAVDAARRKAREALHVAPVAQTAECGRNDGGAVESPALSAPSAGSQSESVEVAGSSPVGAASSMSARAKRDEGGTAFPCPDQQHQGGLDGQYGMSLRDYFAAKVLQGFAANPAIFAPNSMSGWSLVNITDADLVGYAYKLADDAVKARKE